MKVVWRSSTTEHGALSVLTISTMPQSESLASNSASGKWRCRCMYIKAGSNLAIADRLRSVYISDSNATPVSFNGLVWTDPRRYSCVQSISKLTSKLLHRVSVTLSVISPTGQTPQQIFTVDSLKDADLRKDVPFAVSMTNFRGPKSPKAPTLGGLNRHFKENMRKIQIAISSDLCIRLT